MKKTEKFLIPLFMLCFFAAPLLASSNSVVVWEGAVTVDGVLEPIEWDKANGLTFVKGSEDLTGSWYMQEGDTLNDGYTDMSVAVVKFLHQGTDLYISVSSNDSSLCYWGWESDGFFTKIKNALDGNDEEYKYMFDSQGLGDNAILGSKLADEAYGTGICVLGTGGGVPHNNADDPDFGYNMEIVIHLAKQGYQENDIVKAAITIFDMDYCEPKTDNSDFFKAFWGSEWGGGQYGDLVLAKAPDAVDAFIPQGTITLDGKLDEADWQGAQYLYLGWDQPHNTGQWYMQAGSETNDGYLDQSMAVVKFLHVGTDIYIGIMSNDSSICKKGDGWEADGLFLNLQDAITGNKTEYKLMFFGDSVGGPAVAEGGLNNTWTDGASYCFPGGGMNHNDDDDPDFGYSLEAKIPAGLHGYIDGDSVLVGLVMWDMDGYQVADDNSDYAKAWWGNEWGGSTRADWKAIVLSSGTVDLTPQIVVEPTNLDFGNVEVNSSSTKSFMIKNKGNADLLVSDITSNENVFTTNFTSAKGTIKPGGQLEVIVTFLPDEEKTYEGKVTIANNDESAEISLTGIGIKAATDKPSVVVWSGAVTVDGVLEPIEWDKANGIVFHKDSKDVTGFWYMQGEDPANDGYTDASTAVVKFLHQGTDLYISVASNDSSICYWGWESDGLFFKIKYAESQLEEEYKFMYDSQNPGDAAVLGSKLADPEWGSGYSVEVAGGGQSHDNADDPDFGYTMEVVVHLEQQGYKNGDIVKVAMAIWDMDYCEPKDANSDYAKTWWGSEWGGEYRDLILAVAPEAIHANNITSDITLDGQLDEADWNNANELVMGWDRPSITGQWYMQSGDDTNDGYIDQSKATVKFLRNGTDIYLGIVSDDKSICKKGDGWEADGLFLLLKDLITGSTTEYKAMFFGDSVGGPANIEGGVNNEWTDGASYCFPGGGMNRNDDDDPDNGYSLEVKIPAGLHGYLEDDSVLVGLVIWDMDGYQVKDDNSDYTKTWWGNEWGGTARSDWAAIVLSDGTTGIANKNEEEIVPTQYRLSQNFPNPFNPTTTISFELPERSNVTIEVYNMMGQKIRTLVKQKMDAGTHNISWDSRDEKGNTVSTGIYLYKMKAGNFTKTNKMLYIR